MTTKTKILNECRLAGKGGVDVAGFSEVERAVLQAGIEGVAVAADRVYFASSIPTGLTKEAAEVLAALEGQPWTPPDLPLSDRGFLRELERSGLACECGDVWFAVSAIDSAVDVLTELLAESGEGITVSDARIALASTRKFVLPLLRYLDAAGITRRMGDHRTTGPVLLRRQPDL
jgi:hypothetical protein